MIKFIDDTELVRDPLLIYHFESDSIKYFNEMFIKLFGVNQERFMKQINNYQISFD